MTKSKTNKARVWTLVGVCCLVGGLLVSYSNCGKLNDESVNANARVPRLNFASSLASQWDVRFAVIGDYGQQGEKLQKVSQLIKSWNVDFVVTTGDNNYYFGEAENLEANIGQYFADFIYPYRFASGPRRGEVDGSRGSPTKSQRFFPALGNHDWYATKARPEIPSPAPAGRPPLLDWLDLPEGPGQERYYDVVKGPIHFFMLDSDWEYESPIHGVTPTSQQGRWLQEKMREAREPFKVVVFHHPVLSAGNNGNSLHMDWPFREWGASVVMVGHEHVYEQYLHDGIYHIINGIGGHSLTPFKPEAPVQPESRRYNEKYGAMLVMANRKEMITQLYNEDGQVVPGMSVRIGPSGVALPDIPDPAVGVPYIGGETSTMYYLTLTGTHWTTDPSLRPRDFEITATPAACAIQTQDPYYYNGRDGTDLQDLSKHQANLPLIKPTMDVPCVFRITRLGDGRFTEARYDLRSPRLVPSVAGVPSPALVPSVVPNPPSAGPQPPQSEANICELRLASSPDGLLLPPGTVGRIANRNGLGLPTSLTFVRSSPLAGEFFWWVAGSQPHKPAELQNPLSRVTLDYVGVPAKYYRVFSEIRTPTGVAGCVPLDVVVVE